MSSLYLSAAAIDAALDKIASSTELHLVEGNNIPVSRGDVTANTVGSISVSSGDFSISDVSGGRRLLVGKKDDAVLTKASENVRWIALIDGEDLLYAKELFGAPLVVPAEGSRDLEFGSVDIMFEGVVS